MHQTIPTARQEKKPTTRRYNGPASLQAAEQRVRAHDDEGRNPGIHHREQQPVHEAAYERACHALAVFDAEHPQIITVLREQEATDVRRRLESD
ncbi:hypothetical protein ABZ599_38735 [Streptomyces misionensis]|uniref:hypothetical protein n=1 Tax=Streptomyces misionensis TaxID=67331 RepID=UPI00340B38A3